MMRCERLSIPTSAGAEIALDVYVPAVSKEIDLAVRRPAIVYLPRRRLRVFKRAGGRADRRAAFPAGGLQLLCGVVPRSAQPLSPAPAGRGRGGGVGARPCGGRLTPTPTGSP